jgi:hypothetical protein
LIISDESPCLKQQPAVVSSHYDQPSSKISCVFKPGFLRPYHISAFWSAFDSPDFSLFQRDDNSSQLCLFPFDVVKSLSDKERDFLIRAHLAHLPSKQILNLVQQGNTGLPFTGKFTELCRPGRSQYKWQSGQAPSF